MNKFRAKKCVIDGITFDSKKEGRRYQELKLLERAGEIEGLKLQVPYELIPKNDKYRAIKLTVDFVYTRNGETVVEDSKGVRTRDYIMRAKMLYHFYGIIILET